MSVFRCNVLAQWGLTWGWNSQNFSMEPQFQGNTSPTLDVSFSLWEKLSEHIPSPCPPLPERRGRQAYLIRTPERSGWGLRIPSSAIPFCSEVVFLLCSSRSWFCLCEGRMEDLSQFSVAVTGWLSLPISLVHTLAGPAQLLSVKMLRWPSVA